MKLLIAYIKQLPEALRMQLLMRLGSGATSLLLFIAVWVLSGEFAFALPCLILSVFLLINSWSLFRNIIIGDYLCVSGLCEEVERTVLRRRIWPLILLAIVGIIIAALRLLFLSSNKVEVVKPMLALPAPKEEPNERDVRDMAYAVIMNRITLMVTGSFPDARWIWAEPDARRRIENGEDVYILLNRAGGYRKAKVRIDNLQVQEIVYSFDSQDEPEDIPVDPTEDDTDSPDANDQPENFELIAYEWVETHIIELNDRCNEAIGEGKNVVILTPCIMNYNCAITWQLRMFRLVTSPPFGAIIRIMIA